MLEERVNDMLGEIREVNRNKVKAMAVKTSCPVTELPKVIGESYAKIMAMMNQFGSIPAGAPYVAYLNQDMNDLQLEIAIPTAVYIADTEEVVMTEIPEGKYVSAVYTGPYRGLEEAYKAMAAYMNEKGLEAKGAVYESYLNDPENTPEERLMTEILFGIQVN